MSRARISLLAILTTALLGAATTVGMLACGSSSGSSAAPLDEAGSPTGPDGSGPGTPPDPSLDPTFGTGGIATLDVDVRPVRASVRADGSIVVLGSTAKSVSVLARVAANGALDTAFGTPPIGFDANALAVDDDGRISVTGSRGEDGKVARFLASGAPDPSFGADGKRTFSGNSITDVSLRGAIAEPGGSIITQLTVAGGVPSSTSEYYLRITADGGSVGLPANGTTKPPVDLHERAPDGRFVGVRLTRLVNDHTAAPAILTSQGTLDPSFGDGGIGESVPFFGSKLARASDGKLVVLAQAGAQGPVLYRFLATGAVDTAFKQSASSSLPKNSDDFAFTADGKVVIAGYNRASNDATRAGVTRLNGDGTLDTSFAKAGVFESEPPFGGSIEGGPIVVQPSGRVVALFSTKDALGTTRMRIFGFHP